MFYIGEWIIPLLFFLIFFAASYVSSRSLKRALEPLIPYFNGCVSMWFFAAVFKGSYQGMPFMIKLEPGGKNSPPYLRISLDKRCGMTLKISRESVFTLIGKKIGLIREVRVFDEFIDKRYLIYSNNPENAGSYLRSSDIKEALNYMFDSKFNSLTADQRGISICKPNYKRSADLELQQLRQVLKMLCIVGRGL